MATLEELETRVAALEQRLSVLENRPAQRAEIQQLPTTVEGDTTNNAALGANPNLIQRARRLQRGDL
jgi:hypothetical protein